jgi:hypothetical protein
VPWHVARLVTRIVARLIVDNSASRRLVVDYFASAARPGASTRRAARHANRRAARRRLLRLRRASGCLGTSRGSPLVVEYSASRRLVVDYFASAARPGASARRAAHRQLLRLRRASGCLGTSHGSSLVVDYFAYAARLGASARRAARRVARCAARRRLLRLHRASECLGTSRGPS